MLVKSYIKRAGGIKENFLNEIDFLVVSNRWDNYDGSPEHQLLQCLEVQDTNHLQLKQELNVGPPNLI